MTYTDSTSDNWWEVDLKGLHQLEQIVLYNRDVSQRRLSNFRVSIWNGSTEVMGGNYFVESGTHAGSVFSLSSIDGAIADRVRIELLGTNSHGDKVLSLAEVQVYGEEWSQPPVANDATFAVAESIPSGTAVGVVAASDPNLGDTLSYAITAGNTGGTFAIDSGTGAITSAAALDYETTTSYALTVTVTDDGSPAMSDTATITVNVTDVTPTESYHEWRVAQFGDDAGQSFADPYQDPDSDELTNAEEFVFGGNPLAYTEPVLMSELSPSNFIYRFTPAAVRGAEIKVQWSEDLDEEGWEDLSTRPSAGGAWEHHTTLHELTVDPTTGEVSVELPGTAARGFVRILVTI